MCKECGCGLAGEVHIDGQPGSTIGSPRLSRSGAAAPAEGRRRGPEVAGAHADELDRGHPHDHSPHDHEAAPEQGHRVISVERSILEKNERLAERNRGFFQAKKLLVLNLVSAPGSGKTTFIQKTAEALRGRLRLGVIVGDLATDNDARRLRSVGLPVVQITTGTVCHLEAEMVVRAVERLDVDALDVLLIENVGNLVCPASYDLGEHLRVVLLSVTEGEDKPLKYPPMFHSADVAILTKCDLAEASGFDRDLALANLRRVSHHAQVFELSARTGQGMEDWCRYLGEQREAQRH